MINTSYFGSPITSQLSRDISNIRERIEKTSSEAVTGKAADPTAHLSGQIGKAMLTQQAVEAIDRDTSLLQLREARLDITQQSLERMQDNLAAISVRALDALSAGSPAEREALAGDARAQLDAALISLNARHGERFLFSGDATDRAATGILQGRVADGMKGRKVGVTQGKKRAEEAAGNSAVRRLAGGDIHAANRHAGKRAAFNTVARPNGRGGGKLDLAGAAC